MSSSELPDRWQRYETSRDRTRERLVIETVLFLWGCDAAHKIDESRSYGIDYTIEDDGRVVCFAEIKCRNWRKGFGDGFNIGLRKLMQARVITASSGLPCVIIVEFSGDALWWASLTRQAAAVKWWGWNEPRDARDLEPTAVIAWDQFMPITRKPWGPT